MDRRNSVSIPQEFRAMRTTLTISNREIRSDHGGATAGGDGKNRQVCLVVCLVQKTMAKSGQISVLQVEAE